VRSPRPSSSSAPSSPCTGPTPSPPSTAEVAALIGVYPGSFNPPTVAHLAVAAAARDRLGLDRVDLVVSERPLGKDGVDVPTLDDRIAVLRSVAASRPWLGVRRTPARLLADIAEGYDALVIGADKWHQLLDPAWYGDSAAARDAALARLPILLVVPRPPAPPPSADDPRCILLPVEAAHAPVSSSAVRAGRLEWMAPEAAAWDAATGAWSDPDRYRPGMHDPGGAGR
jgi:nicotinic acid mononucleotide adenylyltransferase